MGSIRANQTINNGFQGSIDRIGSKRHDRAYAVWYHKQATFLKKRHSILDSKDHSANIYRINVLIGFDAQVGEMGLLIVSLDASIEKNEVDILGPTKVLW